MDDPDYIKCRCIECEQPIEFPSYGVGERVKCPHCKRMTRLYPPIPPKPPVILGPLLEPTLCLCKTCSGGVAPSAEICVHCGQMWPTLSLPCPRCGVDDFELVSVEDTSSVWVTPSLLGVLSATLWAAM